MFVGIDIGTSGSKGVLVASDGRVVERSSVSHTVSRPRPGWAEHDAEAVWWRDFTTIARRLTARIRPADIAGVGVSGLGPCLLPADESGRPLRPAILYGIDARAVTEITEMTKELGAASIQEACGAELTTQSVGPKLRWLRRHEPQVHNRMRKFFSSSSYLVHRLTGSYVLDRSTASHFLPLYDMRTRNWHGRWARTPDVGAALPKLMWSTEVAGLIGPSSAAETGLPEGAPVAVGALDACAESLSVGVRRPGDGMIMYGSTMVFAQITDGRWRPPGLWFTEGVLPGTRFVVGSVTTAGALASWLSDATGIAEDELMQQSARVPAGSRGVLVLPYLAGERTLLSNPYARGVLAGLSTSHTPAEIYRAALEGTAYAIQQNLAAAQVSGATVPALYAVGGGTRGRLWVQIVSDVTGLSQRLPRDTSGAALGSAMLAAIATGGAEEPWSWNPRAATIEPDRERHACYQEYLVRFRPLYEATREICAFLATQQLYGGAAERE